MPGHRITPCWGLIPNGRLATKILGIRHITTRPGDIAAHITIQPGDIAAHITTRPGDIAAQETHLPLGVEKQLEQFVNIEVQIFWERGLFKCLLVERSFRQHSSLQENKTPQSDGNLRDKPFARTLSLGKKPKELTLLCRTNKEVRMENLNRRNQYEKCTVEQGFRKLLQRKPDIV